MAATTGRGDFPLNSFHLRHPRYKNVVLRRGVVGQPVIDAAVSDWLFPVSTDNVVAASLVDKPDTLTATVTLQAGVSIDGAITDRPETLTATVEVTNSLAGALLDTSDTLVSAITIPVTVTAAVIDGQDTLTATIGGPAPADLTAAIVDSADRLDATVSLGNGVNGTFIDAPDTVTGQIGTPNAINGTLFDRPDVLNGDLDTPFYLNAALNFPSGFWGQFVWGQDQWGIGTAQHDRLTAAITLGPEIVAQTLGGGKRRGYSIKYTFTRKLEEALETIEDIKPSARVKVNKAKIKKAIEVVRSYYPPPSYAAAINAIEKSLVAVSRATAKHQGMVNSLMVVAMDMQNLIAEMQRDKRERQKREEEALLWLL